MQLMEGACWWVPWVMGALAASGRRGQGIQGEQHEPGRLWLDCAGSVVHFDSVTIGHTL